MQIVIQLSSPAESSGFDDDDMESGDNGFPGDADEGDVTFSSWPEIAVCYSWVFTWQYRNAYSNRYFT